MMGRGEEEKRAGAGMAVGCAWLWALGFGLDDRFQDDGLMIILILFWDLGCEIRDCLGDIMIGLNRVGWVDSAHVEVRQR